jgi:uncharacterized membrane protein YhaH (DUF805 family)
MNLQRRRGTIVPMESSALFFSMRGRVGPRVFGYAVAGVYCLIFLSQMLISPPVTVRFGLLPFFVLQAMLVWVWLALHVKRLRDAGYPPGPAIGIAALYALAIVLLVLLVDPMIGHDAEAVGADAGRFNQADLWTFVRLISAVAGQVDFGFFDVFVLVVLLLILTPVLIAIGFSIWTAKRPPAEQGAAVP